MGCLKTPPDTELSEADQNTQNHKFLAHVKIPERVNTPKIRKRARHLNTIHPPIFLELRERKLIKIEGNSF